MRRYASAPRFAGVQLSETLQIDEGGTHIRPGMEVAPPMRDSSAERLTAIGDTELAELERLAAPLERLYADHERRYAAVLLD
jgi:hypothetical protein